MKWLSTLTLTFAALCIASSSYAAEVDEYNRLVAIQNREIAAYNKANQEWKKELVSFNLAVKKFMEVPTNNRSLDELLRLKLWEARLETSLKFLKQEEARLRKMAAFIRAWAERHPEWEDIEEDDEDSIFT